MADVARLAGVSKATASRALGNYGAVSETVRERVATAARELDYRPNELARSMNTGRSMSIGVVVGDIENGYFGLAMRGITDTARRAGYDVVLANTSESVEAEIDAVKVLLDKRVDGLIISPASAYETQHLHDARDTGRPIVLLDRRLPGLDVPSVEVDIAPAARAATTALIESGHRRIAFISALTTDGPEFTGLPLGVSSVTDRLEGMLQALGAAGLDVSADLIRFGAVSRETTRQIVRQLFELPDPPTAVLASDSVIALDVLLALRERGLTVPDEVSFVAFDDFSWAELIDPPLTIVSQPVHQVGVTAAEVLLLMLQGGRPATQRHTLVADLVNRGSTGRPRLSARAARPQDAG
ncbi:LacI family DNA-binding transcriptional regulator [Modestobacter marinus]|uniref:LacI family transcriptional regulator n=1 Tax=Modestobacter marinus TaxID=477641 RepID=A0ABQ2G098_9ACTN|nr:LacI family transcriptional regulator [Modestobacter marinus]